MAAQVKQRYGDRIESLTLIPGKGGVYEFSIDGRLVFSKKAQGRFPDDEEIYRLIDAA
ncbi:MAG: Rdx family protein [Candidatus Marinimicrobia bacterium]|nr:Rdx family protein [Candidatus Neomarinimicrobiota bacterium]